MKQRRIKLLNFLLYSSTPKQIESIMMEFGVSERTVKYDISALREELKSIHVSLLNKRGKGYYFSPKDKPRLLKHYSFEESDTLANKIQRDIILYTLFYSNPIDIKIIANKLYYDETSIKRFVSEKNFLDKQVNLEILDNQQIELKGSELAIRKTYVEILHEKINVFKTQRIKVGLEKLLLKFNIDVEKKWLDKIEQILQKTVQNEKMWISEKSFEYLYLYIYISDLRKKYNDKNLKKESEKNNKLNHLEEYNFAYDIYRQLYWENTKKSEVGYLVKFMLENNIFSKALLDQKTEDKLKIVLEEMMNELDDLSFSKNELINDLLPHLRQIIRVREMGGFLSKNPLFHQVKQKYHKYYKIAQNIYGLFADAFEIEYSDNEASLIAIYLYKNAIHKDDGNYTAYIVCGTGRGFSKLLETRINNIFPDITIKDSLSSFDLLKKQDIEKVDLIISTIPLPKQTVPVVKITSFLSRDDIHLINQALNYKVSAKPYSLSLNDNSKEKNKTDTNIIKNSKRTIDKDNAVAFSAILLELYNFMVGLPQEYKINQEKLLGITIHLTIALPRYFDSSNTLENEEIVNEVLKIEKEHPVLANEMDSFLNIIEKNINQGISFVERYALYQYILN